MQDGDLGTESITVTYDMPMPEIVKPYKSGYAFLGYFSKINGEGERYYDEDAEGVKDWDIDQNTALYAHWDFLEGHPKGYCMKSCMKEMWLKTNIKWWVMKADKAKCKYP